jgi:hypothetical protein
MLNNFSEVLWEATLKSQLERTAIKTASAVGTPGSLIASSFEKLFLSASPVFGISQQHPQCRSILEEVYR